MKGSIDQLKQALKPLGEVINTKNGIKYNCPYCEQNGAPVDKFNLEISYEKGLYNCWACNRIKGSNLAVLINKYGNKHLASLFNKENKNSQKKTENEETLELPSYTYSVLKKPEATSYLIKRGLNKQKIKERNIRWCFKGEYSNSIVFPSYDLQGNLNYFITQNWYSKKYYNCKNTNNICFYEYYLDRRSPIIVTEGIFDALSIPNGNPWLGLNCNDAILTFLTNTSTIVAIDSFVQRSVLKKIINQLKSVCTSVQVFTIPPNYKDLNDMWIRNSQELIKNLKHYYDVENTVS